MKFNEPDLRFRLALFAVSASTILAAGCCPSERASDIGTNHVAVLSVTRWDDYQATLQPKFDLSASQALAAALPDTLQLQQAIQHSFDAALALRVAPSAALPAGFGSGQSGAGFTPSTTQPVPAAPATSQPANVLNPSALGTDAQLQYLAATALFQEVKLINRYVHDAAIPTNYRAYVVRAQISSMPKRRDGAFDTYVDMSMFLNPFNQPLNASPVEKASRAAIARFSDIGTRLAATTQSNDTSPEEKNAANELLEKVRKWNEDVKKTLPKPGESHQPPQGESVPPEVETLRGIQLQIRNAVRQGNKTRRGGEGNKIEPAAPGGEGGGGINPPPAPHLPPDGPWTENRQPVTSVASQLEALEDIAQDLQDNLDRAELHRRLPIVIPLLVTDQVEGALAARRADELQRLALSLSAAYAGVGGNVDVQNVEQAMRSAVGRDYNSLLTVGRVNDNTLRVRIGARMISATSTGATWISAAKQSENYRALAQTHNVSLLVLLPASTVVSHPTNVYFGTHSKFVEVQTGRTIEDPVNEGFAASQLDASYGGDYKRLFTPTTSPAVGELETLAAAAQNSDYATFVDTLAAHGTFDIGRANRLWLQMTEERITSAFDGGHFQAPQYPAASPVRSIQTVILTDDGNQTTGTVGGDLGRFDARPMHAVWVITWQPSEGPKPAALPPNITLVGHAEIVGGQLVLTFPSLKSANVKVLTSNLVVTHANGGPVVVTGEPVYAVQAPSVPKPLGTFTVARAKLAPDANHNDTPTVVVSFSDPFAQYLAGQPPAAAGDNSRFPTLTVDGAEVKVPLPAGLVEDTKYKGTYRITQPGAFALPLTGLVPGTDVTFTIVSPNPQFKAPDARILKVGDFPPVPH